MFLKRTLLGASLIVLSAGCSGSGDETNMASNMSHPMATDTAETMPTGPFAQSEMQMNERMMAAVGANASETWARKMIEHHRGAVEMSQVLVNQGGDSRFAEMARETITKQQREIGELERMVAGGISGGSGDANPFGPIEQQMHQAMMAASGADLGETWARKMVAHHNGAIEMSELLIQQGGDPEVVAMARRAAEDQRRDRDRLEAMLRGEAAPAAAAPTAERPAATPARPAREPSPATKAPATRPPAPREAAPRPTPRPEPSTPPQTTCLPEHRAAGHCK